MTTPFGGCLRAARISSKPWIAMAAVALATILSVDATQDAVANGDTRSLTIYHTHTKESATITFRRNGMFDQEALRQLNWMLRDWRQDEQVRMEPRLFDILWEVYREVGSAEPIHVVSAYRSPETNAMLRRRSKAVAEQSQHMAGRAMDFYLPDVSMSRVREIGMRLQRGGVGFYPNAFNPFVHLDAGSVRSWPRMTHDQLARLFPDGRTVHLPRDGHPLGGYESAKAEILARGGTVAGTTYAEASEESSGRKSLWAILFGGGGDDEDSDYYRSPASRGNATARASRTQVAYAPSSSSSDDAGTRGIMSAQPEVRPEADMRLRRSSRTEVAAAEAPAVESSQLRSALPPVPLPPGAPARIQAEPEPAAVTAFLPPRRPEEFGTVLALAGPLPPARPLPFAGEAATRTASGDQGRAAARAYGAPAWTSTDDRTALKALFDAAAPRAAPEKRIDLAQARPRDEPVGDAARLGEPGPKLRMAFTSDSDELSADTFRGPAVAPLPRLP